MRYIFFFIISFLLPAIAHAGVTHSTNIHPDIYHATANDACASLQSEADNPLVGPNGTVEGIYADGGLACFYRYSDPSQFGGTRIGGFMVGGISPRAISKECKPGDPVTINWPFGNKDPVTGEVPVSSAIVPPWPICSQGCTSEYVSVDSCFTFDDEDNSKVYCDYNASLTGNSCSTSDEPVKPEIPDLPPDPCLANPAGEGCGTDPGDGGGDPGDGGTDPCDTDPAGPGCDDGGDPGDGGGDPGDGGGDPGDGGGDPGDGGGDPGDGGTDPGDGGDGGDDGGSASGHMNCDVALACDGDPIACAQLEVQKGLMCSGSDLDYPGQKDDIDNFLDDPQYQEEEGEEVDVSDLVKEGTRFLPSSCPAPLTESLSGGRSITIPYDPICQIADSLSYLFVALAWVFFALYVGRSSGGE